MNANAKSEAKLPRVSPATDILEKDEGFYIYADMPGVAKDNLVIDLNEDTVTVTGLAEYKQQDGEKLVHAEFAGGEYERTFTLSHIVDKEKIKASFKNGVLELFLPKAEKAQPRKIQIQAE